MLSWVVLGTLAAFGALSLMWTLLGWLLPSGRGAVLVCVGVPDPGMLSRVQWLQGMGLMKCPLVAVTDELPGGMPWDCEICGREQLLQRLEREKEQTYGTGTGDPSGRGQRRGISEL